MKANKNMYAEASKKIIDAQLFLKENKIPLKIQLQFDPYFVLQSRKSTKKLKSTIDLGKHINFFTQIF